MFQNKVSATLTDADRDAVLAAVSTIRQKLPFLIDLSNEERRALPRFGDKSRAFVAKALEVATQNRTALPQSFDLEEMRRDIQLFEDLQPILMAFNKLLRLAEDTSKQAGSEAYGAALSVYSYTKVSPGGEALVVAAGDLGRRFVRKSKGSKSDAGTAPTKP